MDTQPTTSGGAGSVSLEQEFARVAEREDEGRVSSSQIEKAARLAEEHKGSLTISFILQAAKIRKTRQMAQAILRRVMGKTADGRTDDPRGPLDGFGGPEAVLLKSLVRECTCKKCGARFAGTERSRCPEPKGVKRGIDGTDLIVSCGSTDVEYGAFKPLTYKTGMWVPPLGSKDGANVHVLRSREMAGLSNEITKTAKPDPETGEFRVSAADAVTILRRYGRNIATPEWRARANTRDNPNQWPVGDKWIVSEPRHDESYRKAREETYAPVSGPAA